VVPQGSGGASAGQPITDDKLTMIGGSVTSKADVDKVFSEGIDGCVIALGGKTKDVGEVRAGGDVGRRSDGQEERIPHCLTPKLMPPPALATLAPSDNVD